MKYDRLSRDEINKALITIAETMETERQFIKRDSGWIGATTEEPSCS